MAQSRYVFEKRIAAILKAKPTIINQVGRYAERAAERRPVFRFARLILLDHSEIPCILRDQSSIGARIVFYGDVALPPTVMLRLEHSSEVRSAVVVWRKGREAGLRY